MNKIISRRSIQVLTLFTCQLFAAFNSAQAQTSNAPDRFWQPTRTFHTADEFKKATGGRVVIQRSTVIRVTNEGTLTATSGGIVQRKPDGILQPYFSDRLLPINDVKVLAHDQSFIWMGTEHGAFSYNNTSNSPIKYYAGKRWLPDDRVTGFGFENLKGDRYAVWIETAKGYSRIEFRLTTLAEKARVFEQRVRSRHVRHGLTADSHLKVPGDPGSNQMVSSDNDGLWTAMYVAAECFRYKVTGENEALEFARQGLQAIMRLEEISGISGFHARSIIKIGLDEQPKDGEWHTTADGLWRWKGDTSSDEIVGHYFIYPIYYDLVAGDAEKAQIRAVITRMTDHILNNNYQLIDTDGKRTRWGWWGPDTIWEDPDETGLRALHILAHLRVAYHITGNQRYKSAYDDLINKHRYHLLMRNQKINYPGRVNHSDDELAFLSYYPLLTYEDDPELRKIYIQSLERSWTVERPERIPLWNFIYAAGSGSNEFDKSESIRTLREIPMDTISWTVTNSVRMDIPFDNSQDRFNRKQALIVLPYDELPMMKWNGNPFRLDGGNGGRSEDDGAFYLLPYWMGRYHKLIGE
ncbi:MAG: hypothetical protein IPO77_12130 [Acidobacteria bacterium]|nr:hypothetical protein [Acidobacteriota bacterium]